MWTCEWYKLLRQCTSSLNSPLLLPSQGLTEPFARYIFGSSLGHFPSKLTKGHCHLLGTIVYMQVPTDNAEAEVIGEGNPALPSSPMPPPLPLQECKNINNSVSPWNPRAMWQACACGQSVPSPSAPCGRHLLQKLLEAQQDN